jgi:hypothetical protein
MSIKQLASIGTKIWSDSVEPKIIATAVQRGITGATSNPIIIADIIKAGGLDERITQLIEQGLDDSAIAWKLNEELVAGAQRAFADVWQRSPTSGSGPGGTTATSASSSTRCWKTPKNRCRTGSACGGTSSWGSSIRTIRPTA